MFLTVLVIIIMILGIVEEEVVVEVVAAEVVDVKVEQVLWVVLTAKEVQVGKEEMVV